MNTFWWTTPIEIVTNKHILLVQLFSNEELLGDNDDKW